ncbi:MAG: ABC transporter substrate-binding protein, partial [Acidisphaera sp.]|nr:ABC transporter substrate-binding protein [Acidisphaera sp.]
AGSGTDQFIRSLLVARKIVPDEVLRLQPVGSPSAVMAAFDKHLIDGFVLSAPYPDLAQANGTGVIAIDAFRGEIPEIKDVPYTAMLTSRRTMKARPAAIMGTTRALTRAITYAQDHPDDTQRLLHQYFKSVDPALFAKFEPVYRRAAARSPIITQLQYDRLKSWLKLTEAAPADTPYAQAVDTTFATEAAKDLLPTRAPT